VVYCATEQVAFDEGIDVDMTQLFTSIDPAKLPKDPKACTPVYPHMYLKVSCRCCAMRRCSIVVACMSADAPLTRVNVITQLNPIQGQLHLISG
jgi:hypothetical protein